MSRVSLLVITFLIAATIECVQLRPVPDAFKHS